MVLVTLHRSSDALCAAELWRKCPEADTMGCWQPGLTEVVHAVQQLVVCGLVEQETRRKQGVTRTVYVVDADAQDCVCILLDRGRLCEPCADQKTEDEYIERFLISSR